MSSEVSVRAVIAVIAVIEGYYNIPNIRIKFNGNTTKKEDINKRS